MRSHVIHLSDTFRVKLDHFPYVMYLCTMHNLSRACMEAMMEAHVPDPDALVRGTGLAPDSSIIKQK
jgi:hypothetical protein